MLRFTNVISFFFFFHHFSDIDECKSVTLYNCGKGYDCVNTLGSFKCVCNGKRVKAECVKGKYNNLTRLTVAYSVMLCILGNAPIKVKSRREEVAHILRI